MRLPKTLAVGGVLAVTVGLGACSSSPTAPDAPTSLTIAIPGWQFTPNFDPQNGAWLWFMPTRPVYESIINWDTEANEWVPWLAESFEISEDGLTMSVTLRDDVVFTDGSPMDAESVVKSLNATYQSPKSYFNYIYLESQPEAAVTGELTFELRTTKPMYEESTTLLELSQLPIVSPVAIDDPSLVAAEPIGTGPYLLDEVVAETSAHYVRNPDYWNPDAFDFDEITLIVMDDKIAALNALTSGQIDVAELEFSMAAEAEGAGLTINTGPAGLNFIVFSDHNGENFPPLGDVRVRQALNYAIDRESIAELLELGYGNPSSQPFDPASHEYVEGADDRYAYDPDRARELLADAGYADGLTIKLAGEGSPIDYRPVITQYFADVNVTIDWVDTPTGGAGVADLIASKEVGAVFLYSIFSNNVRTWTGEHDFWAMQPLSDPEFTEKLEIYSTGTPSEHASVQDWLAEYILEQALFVSISQPRAIWATSPGVEMTVANMPSFYPTMQSFHAAD